MSSYRKAVFVDWVRWGANLRDKRDRKNRASHAVQLALDMDARTIPRKPRAAAERFLRLLYAVRILPRL